MVTLSCIVTGVVNVSLLVWLRRCDPIVIMHPSRERAVIRTVYDPVITYWGFQWIVDSPVTLEK